MSSHPIAFNLGAGPSVRAAIYAQVYPLLSEAVKLVVMQAAENLATAVQGAKLWSREKDAYVASIKTEMTGAYSGRVWADYKYADEIETGRPAYDQKQMLNTSMKVRQGKKGRYLIIPFRHNTPGQHALGPSMPDHVHRLATALSASTVTGMTSRKSGTGAWDLNTKAPLMVPQRTYSWGARLPPGSMGPNSRHKSDRYAGMVRFESTNKAGARYSEYITFRVLSENSTGWIRKAQPGLNLAQTVATELQPVAEAIFSEAISRSL